MVRKAALYAIILFSGICLLGFFWKDIFTSWFFYLIVIAFFLSLLIAAVYMTKTRSVIARPDVTSGRGNLTGLLILSLHFCLAAGIILIFISRMVRLEGEIVLTEGQELSEEHSNYTRISEGPLFRERHNGFKLRLNKVEVRRTKKGDVPDYVSLITIYHVRKSPVPINAEVRVNHPFKFKGFVIHQSRTGFSPLLTIEEKEKGSLLDSYINLSTVKEDGSERYEDEILIPGDRERLVIRFLPVQGGLFSAEGSLYVTLKDDVRTLGTARLERNESKEIAGYTILFRDLRRWSGLQLVHDPFVPSLYAVFGTGIVLLFVIVFRRI